MQFLGCEIRVRRMRKEGRKPAKLSQALDRAVSKLAIKIIAGQFHHKCARSLTANVPKD